MNQLDNCSEITLLEWLEMENPPPAFYLTLPDRAPRREDVPCLEELKRLIPFFPFKLVENVKRLTNHYYSINGYGVSRDFIVIIDNSQIVEK
jgi:hypothetical protein